VKALPDGILISDTPCGPYSRTSAWPRWKPRPRSSTNSAAHDLRADGSEDSGRRLRTGRPSVHADAPAPRQLPAGQRVTVRSSREIRLRTLIRAGRPA